MAAVGRHRRIYVDSSVWIALLAQEATADALSQWLENESGVLMTAQWTRTELASAMGIKSRRGELTQDSVHALLNMFEQWVQGGCSCCPWTARTLWMRPSGAPRCPQACEVQMRCIWLLRVATR